MSIKYVTAKSMVTSKTFWVNVITAIIAVVAVLNEIAAEMVLFADILVMPTWVTRVLLLVNSVANIILRRISDLPARFTTGGTHVAVVEKPNG